MEAGSKNGFFGGAFRGVSKKRAVSSACFGGDDEDGGVFEICRDGERG
jgi:hypothetical protein